MNCFQYPYSSHLTSPIPMSINFRVFCRSLALIVSILVHCLSHAEMPQDAVVTIFSYVGPDWVFGSGVLTSPDGEVLTCYHVVKDAQKIVIYLTGVPSVSSNVIVERISPYHDLAILRIIGLPHATPHLRVISSLPRDLLHQQLQVFGYLGNDRQRITAHATQSTLASSGSMNIPGQNDLRPLFKEQDVKILPLDCTIYHGLSGGPVVSDAGVIGVISGAVSQGGTFAWAIPTIYFSPNSMLALHMTPGEVKWPPMSLMADDWMNMRAIIQGGRTVAEAVRKFADSLDASKSAVERWVHTAVSLKTSVDKMRSLIDTLPMEYQRSTLHDLSQEARFSKFLEDYRSALQEMQLLLPELQREGKDYAQSAGDTYQNMLSLNARIKEYADGIPKTPENEASLKSIYSELDSVPSRVRTIVSEKLTFPSYHSPNSPTMADNRKWLGELSTLLEWLSLKSTQSAFDEAFSTYREEVLPAARILELQPR